MVNSLYYSLQVWFKNRRAKNRKRLKNQITEESDEEDSVHVLDRHGRASLSRTMVSSFLTKTPAFTNNKLPREHTSQLGTLVATTTDSNRSVQLHSTDTDAHTVSSTSQVDESHRHAAAKARGHDSVPAHCATRKKHQHSPG